ncbi:MAG TPA: DNA topoisomerase IB [Chitinophagaceae bacterium]|nr:DNA topoisomerase IB [Chitinophagaceae bacterium]
MLKAHRDGPTAARIAKLIYVSDAASGISRKKAGKGWTYWLGNRRVRDVRTLERIRKLAIPPSWSNVWICPDVNGHLQATGRDLAGRKQYRYHAGWHGLRNETKFHRMYEFGKLLPRLRNRLQRDMQKNELSEEKVVATVISLMEKTYIRVGNEDYEKLYGSYGITTLRDKHVDVRRDSIKFCFTGKKGIEHSITLRSRKLARIVRQCRDIPGAELFQYYNGDGDRKRVDSGMINEYIRNATGKDFTAKDFRTWAGTLQAICCLRQLQPPMDEATLRKNIAAMLDEVSERLGNSRTICRKYYVHPGLVKLYEEGELLPELAKCNEKSFSGKGLSRDEQILMALLKRCAS